MSGSVLSGRHHSQPNIYAGSRRRVTGLGTIGAGFVALVLVLGALLTSELNRYGGSDADSGAPSAARPPALTPGAPAAPPVLPDDSPGSPDESSASPDVSPAPGGATDPQPSGAATDATNRAVLTTVNRSLAELGCDELTYSPVLRAAAQAHVTAMIRTGYLTLVMPDGSDPGKRARAAGYQRNVLEAIVLGAETPNQAAAVGFPAVATDPPASVRTESTGGLKCGYRSVGADLRRDSRNVPITVIMLGK